MFVECRIDKKENAQLLHFKLENEDVYGGEFYSYEYDCGIYDLKIGNTYEVFGIVIFQNKICYLIFSEIMDSPQLFPSDIFYSIDVGLREDFYFYKVKEGDVISIVLPFEQSNALEFIIRLIKGDRETIKKFLEKIVR